MKVNISYAVELQDVPAEVGKLLFNVASHMTVLLNDVEEVAAANPTKAIASITRIREGLADLDLRLADCSSILAGYVDIQNKSVPGSTPLEVEDESSV